MRLPGIGTSRRALFQPLEAALLALLLAGCGRVASGEAQQLVERYNKIVCEAYRRGDVTLIDPVVGPNEGRRILGLIGVRNDLGLTMDAQPLKIEVTGVERAAGTLRVRTKEEWTYRDLKIGSGEQVGQASRDAYEMLYIFTNLERRWVVDEIRFAAAPQVGRARGTWSADHGDAAKKEAAP